eukprot:SAG11_NODE_8075_length_1062_cov_1.772586_1_plen_86_part_00
MDDLRKRKGGTADGEESDAIQVVNEDATEVEINTWIETSVLMLEKCFEFTEDKRFRNAIAALQAEADSEGDDDKTLNGGGSPNSA